MTMKKNDSINIAININSDQYLEIEKICIGAFAPLHAFMNEVQFNSVVDLMRLPTGDPFPIPIVLDIDYETQKVISKEDVVDLVFEGEIVARIWPNDFFQCDRRLVAKKIFGTDNLSHPGVNYFYDLKNVFMGGRVEMLRSPSFSWISNELTPQRTRSIFKERGWERIVGFQTRNVPHRAHEYLLRVGLECADGLFIQPIVGRKKAGDFTPSAIIKGYYALIKNYFPEGKIVLGSLSTVMRYAGPREAIFHAIIRRNYGCTHFIVGRDHAGVGDWYGIYDAHKLVRQFDGDLGIEVLRFKGPFYCRKCDGIATENTCSHVGSSSITHISGTDMRKILLNGEAPLSHLMRQEVVAALVDTAGKPLIDEIFCN